MRAALALAALAGALALVPAAVAHAESEAAALRPDVVAAWHDPANATAGAPWTVWLRLAPGSNVTAAAFQVCRVGQACFNPPTPARSLGNGTFTFSSSDVVAGGHAVQFGPGWRLGVRWLLTERGANGTTRLADFPDAPDGVGPCVDVAALPCQEAHYVAFTLAPAPASAPAPAAACTATLLASAALAARKGRHGG